MTRLDSVIWLNSVEKSFQSPVLPVTYSNTNYTLYWRPTGAPQYPADYQPGVDRYFTDLEHDSAGVLNTDSVLSQYNDAAGERANYDSHFRGALIDTNSYPASGCPA